MLRAECEERVATSSTSAAQNRKASDVGKNLFPEEEERPAARFLRDWMAGTRARDEEYENHAGDGDRDDTFYGVKNDGILNLLFDYHRSDRGTRQHNYGFLYDRLFYNGHRCDVELVGEVGVGPLADPIGEAFLWNKNSTKAKELPETVAELPPWCAQRYERFRGTENPTAACDEAHKSETAADTDKTDEDAAVADWLENGYAPGAGLRAWSDFFPNAKVVGFDISTEAVARARTRDFAKFRVASKKDDRIETVILNSFNKTQVETWAARNLYNAGRSWDHGQEAQNSISTKFDLFIDDGLHEYLANRATLSFWWPHLRENGTYVVEDVPIAVEDPKTVKCPVETGLRKELFQIVRSPERGNDISEGTDIDEAIPGSGAAAERDQESDQDSPFLHWWRYVARERSIEEDAVSRGPGKPMSPKLCLWSDAFQQEIEMAKPTRGEFGVQKSLRYVFHEPFDSATAFVSSSNVSGNVKDTTGTTPSHDELRTAPSSELLPPLVRRLHHGKAQAPKGSIEHRVHPEAVAALVRQTRRQNDPRGPARNEYQLEFSQTIFETPPTFTCLPPNHLENCFAVSDPYNSRSVVVLKMSRHDRNSIPLPPKTNQFADGVCWLNFLTNYIGYTIEKATVNLGSYDAAIIGGVGARQDEDAGLTPKNSELGRFLLTTLIAKDALPDKAVMKQVKNLDVYHRFTFVAAKVLRTQAAHEPELFLAGPSADRQRAVEEHELRVRPAGGVPADSRHTEANSSASDPTRRTTSATTAASPSVVQTTLRLQTSGSSLSYVDLLSPDGRLQHLQVIEKLLALAFSAEKLQRVPFDNPDRVAGQELGFTQEPEDALRQLDAQCSKATEIFQEVEPRSAPFTTSTRTPVEVLHDDIVLAEGAILPENAAAAVEAVMEHFLVIFAHIREMNHGDEIALIVDGKWQFDVGNEFEALLKNDLGKWAKHVAAAWSAGATTVTTGGGVVTPDEGGHNSSVVERVLYREHWRLRSFEFSGGGGNDGIFSSTAPQLQAQADEEPADVGQEQYAFEFSAQPNNDLKTTVTIRPEIAVPPPGRKDQKRNGDATSSSRSVDTFTCLKYLRWGKRKLYPRTAFLRDLGRAFVHRMRWRATDGKRVALEAYHSQAIMKSKTATSTSLLSLPEGLEEDHPAEFFFRQLYVQYAQLFDFLWAVLFRAPEYSAASCCHAAALDASSKNTTRTSGDSDTGSAWGVPEGGSCAMSDPETQAHYLRTCCLAATVRKTRYGKALKYLAEKINKRR